MSATRNRQLPTRKLYLSVHSFFIKMLTKLLYKGSVKEVYEVNEEELEFRFTDRISVFDQIIPNLIPHKGESLCREGAYWFDRAKKMGIKTHFLKLIAPNIMRVKKVNVIADYKLLNKKSTNCLIPVEFITRYYVAGFLFDRLKNGTIKPENVGFPKNHNPIYGEELPEPYFEMSTKLEDYDTFINKERALKISGMSFEELDAIRETILRIDETINKEVKARGLIHVDGKKEFAFDTERNLMIVDVFGTADEDRFWDLENYMEGNYIELSKEYVRQYYRRIGFKDKLYEAREKGFEEPKISPLPEEIIKETSNIYIDLFKRITGENFR